MIGYKYNEFVIKQQSYSGVTSWNIFKDDKLYSIMAFSNPFTAKKILDLVYPTGKESDLEPFNYTP